MGKPKINYRGSKTALLCDWMYSAPEAAKITEYEFMTMLERCAMNYMKKYNLYGRIDFDDFRSHLMLYATRSINKYKDKPEEIKSIVAVLRKALSWGASDGLREGLKKYEKHFGSRRCDIAEWETFLDTVVDLREEGAHTTP